MGLFFGLTQVMTYCFYPTFSILLRQGFGGQAENSGNLEFGGTNCSAYSIAISLFLVLSGHRHPSFRRLNECESVGFNQINFRS